MTAFTITVPDQLLTDADRAAIAEIVREAIRDEVQRALSLEAVEMYRLMDREETARFLGYANPGQISQLASAGVIPYVEINGTRRYRKADLIRRFPAQIAGSGVADREAA